MESLNDEDWKKFQNFVKEQDDKNSKELIGVSLYTATLIIKPEEE